MSDFFVKKDSKVETNLKNKPAPTLDNEFLEVKLSSIGKLGAPVTLHIRDYSVPDLIKMAMSTELNVLDKLMEVLDGAIQEDFDPRLLHQNELEELMINMYANYWSPYLLEYMFPLTQEEYTELSDQKKAQMKLGQWLPTIDINLSTLKTHVLAKDFKLPIKIEFRKRGYRFDVTRIKHLLIAKQRIVEEFAFEMQKFHKTERQYQINSTVEDTSPKWKEIPLVELTAYEEYLALKTEKLLTYTQAQLILGVGEEATDTFEKQLEAHRKIPHTVWEILDKEIVGKYMGFGIDHDIEVVSPLDGKKVERRFSFRTMDFIPPDELRDNTEYSVSLG